MSCKTEVEDKSQLFCTFPQSVNRIEDLVVYFNPDSGQERMVVRCVMLEELECTNERGFSCRVSDPHLAEITLPDSLKTESGSFRCQISGLAKSEIKRCMWLTEENDSFDEAVKNNTTLSHESLPDGVSTVAVAAAIGIIVTVISLVFISIVLYKKVYKKSPILDKNPKLKTEFSSMSSHSKQLCIHEDVEAVETSERSCMNQAVTT